MHATKRPAKPSTPTLRAEPIDLTEVAVPARLLTERQRQELASLATRVHLSPREIIYRAHTVSTAVYICGEGAVKAYRELASGKRKVTSFMFPDDLFGLAKNGRYINTTQAMTKTMCYRLPLDPLKAVLLQDAELQFKFLTKITHELRESQHHAIMVGRRSAIGRFAMFLKMIETSLVTHAAPGLILLPMSRSDIADYLGLTLESVSRASTELAKTGVIVFQGQHAVRVLDRRRLEHLAGDL